ncbi:GNAT family N-acetyltransferase [Kitasatospora sp. NPDC052868]|uniref:GNAT family N-acetyltransferase n=1 Tax=Kitasatospora sp. NPDC052868 TaxID=3364060 RepID=UPI0037C69587
MRLRELNLDDAEAVQRIYSGSSVRHLDRPTMNRAEANTYVAQAVALAAEQPPRLLIFGIDLDSDLIGVIKLDTIDNTGRLSYILREDTWNRGYATRAVADLLAHAFGVLQLPSIRARHRVDNLASGKVLVRAGFIYTYTVDGLVNYLVRQPS